MAKRKSVDEAYNAIKGQLDDVIKETVKKASKESTKDIELQAKKSVMRYYNTYAPTSYRRTYKLYNSYKKYNKISGNTIKAGVIFDADLMKGRHHSNSRHHQRGSEWKDWEHRNNGRDNGMPEDEYIMGAFLEGIHPIYTVFYDQNYQSRAIDSPNRKRVIGVEENFKMTSPSPYELMANYLDSYGSKAQEIVNTAFVEACMKYFY